MSQDFQPDFTDFPVHAYPGSLDYVPNRDGLENRYKNASATAIKPGYAVQQGTNTWDCDPNLTAVEKFLGIAVLNQTHEAVNYAQHEFVTFLKHGRIWCPVEAAVTVGAIVTVKTTTGQLSMTAVGGTQLQLKGMRWVTAQATAGGLALLDMDATARL